MIRRERVGLSLPLLALVGMLAMPLATGCASSIANDRARVEQVEGSQSAQSRKRDVELDAWGMPKESTADKAGQLLVVLIGVLSAVGLAALPFLFL